MSPEKILLGLVRSISLEAQDRLDSVPHFGVNKDDAMHVHSVGDGLRFMLLQHGTYRV